VLTEQGQQAEHHAAHKRLRFKTLLMILVMIVAGPLGNVLLGRGMEHAGDLSIWPPPALLHTGIKIFSTPSIWLGIGSLVTMFVSYMLVLSWADYSFVQPATSLAYGVVALLSWLILGEHISPLHWAGIAVICIGVFVVGQTNPRTTASTAETAAAPELP
jgi:multidrug transporter EmrE-like cation transporter